LSLEFWRDVAVVWLSLLCFIAMIIPLVIAFFAVKGMHAAVSCVPHWLGIVQGYSRRGRNLVERTARQAAQPVIRGQRELTRIETTIQRLVTGRRPDNGASDIRPRH
jgi:hypothetical protein